MRETIPFYTTIQWKECRKAFMRSRRGLCEECLKMGLITPAEIVHHKIHLNGDNINDPNIPGNLYKSYQDNSPKLDRKIKSNKKRPKSNFYQNKILNKKSLLQKIGINLDKLVSPIHSIKHIKKSSLTKKNNNIPIFEIYNNNRIKKKMSESYNNTTF